MLKTLKSVLYSGAIALMLTACGGGGDNKSSGYTLLDPKPNQLYTGNRNPSLLDDRKTTLFASLIVGDVTPSETLLAKENTSSTLLLNQPALIANLSNKIMNTTKSSQLHAREVSEQVSCEFGGEASVAGDLNDEEETGVLVYTYQNCQLESDSVLNGRTSITIHSNFSPESYTIAFDALEISANNDTYTLTGTLDYVSEYNIGVDSTVIVEKEVINLITVHSATQLATYFQNYTSFKESISVTIQEQSISGRVFISDEGYVTVSTAPNYISKNDGESVIPEQGTILMTGASQSQGRIDSSGLSQESYRLNLDQDGDDIYELTSLQNHSPSNNSGEWSDNQAPVAVISADQYSWDENSHTDETEYTRGTILSLHSANSYDPDNVELSYVWTIEEKPSTSTATLEANSHGPQHLTFTPDVPGKYKISLKVTDDFGSQQSSIDFITVKVVNIAPTITTTLESDISELNIEQSLNVLVTATDEDTLIANYGDGDVVINYTWLERPEGSRNEFIAFSTYNDTDLEFGQTVSNDYSLLLDQPGTYKAQFTATDSDGSVSTSLIEFTVGDAQLADSDIYCESLSSIDQGCDWETKTATLGPMLISLSEESSLFSNCSWTIYSEAVDSTGFPISFYDVGRSIEFTPPDLGSYTVVTECLAPTGTYINSTLTIVE